MQKIVITGGMGYIGTELCKLYSGESRFKKIVVIDKKFCSDRVKQLRDWGMEYHQASIMDKDAMRQHLSDADIVFHLAGITDVAYTKTQSNVEQDQEIKEVGIGGTRNVIEASVKPDCKIIFPSTHVVYEGFSETKKDITEEVSPCPVLTYSTGKVQSEKDLIESGKNYVILRLASVYGYSGDTMRMGIMPNLFSKIASQNGTIKMFSGGVQIKSLVPVFDVARCMKFVAENSMVGREIFHLSKDSVTVKEVAEACKEINPKLTIVSTDDEIPNLGYTISNKKLLEAGFQFKYDLKTCLKQMIDNWSQKDINPALEYVDKGGKEFRDDRGVIRNYELTEPINLIGCIESHKYSVRANHFHPIQEQKCLLIQGQYISVTKDLSVENALIETKVINPGDLAIIKPNVAHAMVFTADSIFLNLVRGEREHENYGQTHTFPYDLVSEEFKKKLLENYRTECRSCGRPELERVLSFGNSPLANNLKATSTEASEEYPLEMNYCPLCHNCQLSVVVPPEKMFDEYLYVSSTTSSFRKHFENAAEKYITEFGLDSNSLVIDIGSNDGVFLKPLQDRGVRVLGVEPASNIAKLANDSKINTLNRYFDRRAVTEIIENHIGSEWAIGGCRYADLVTASNVFAHSDKLREIATNAFHLLKKDGTFILEVQYLLDTIKDLTFDNIYHEHTNYWSVLSLDYFFRSLHAKIYKVEHVDTHGGSIRVYVKSNNRTESKTTIDPSVEEFIKREQEFGLRKLETYKKFGGDVAKIRHTVRENFKKLKQKYPVLAGYGSPAKATTALNYFGIDSSVLDYTIEDNSMKHGKYIPGVNIPIRDKQTAIKNPPGAIVVLAWNFYDAIVANNLILGEAGVRFINIKDLQNPEFEV